MKYILKALQHGCIIINVTKQGYVFSNFLSLTNLSPIIIMINIGKTQFRVGVKLYSTKRF